MRDKHVLAPNLMTVVNILLGFLAITFAAKEQFMTGAWLIIIAAVCDKLDGLIARATEGTTEFGLEFDSLADVVSFGVAPAFLIYFAQMRDFEPLGLIVSFLPLAAGAIRLARFNTSTSNMEKHHFEGMPIPAGAGLLCSYIIFSIHLWDEVRFPILTAVLILAAATLMVSTIEFDAMPRLSFRHGRRNTIQIFLLLISIALIVILKEKALFPLATGYVLIQIGRAGINYLRNDDEDTLPDISMSKH